MINTVIFDLDGVICDTERSRFDLSALHQLNMPVEECIAIEDTPLGIQSAQSAGLICIAVTHTHSRDELAGADAIIDGLPEFTGEFISRLQIRE
ncbi:MAG: HAD family phosphatase [Candidatus Sungbacteria bacterium]|nr:HAD family phosphatase [Candidatus Sungbacteria bacterium]